MKDSLMRSFSLTLIAMFFFISLINARMLGDNLLITLSLFVNITGIACLGPLLMGKEWADRPIIVWLVLYVGFLLFNVLNGWLVNTTGYMMLLLALAIVFMSREKML